MHLFYYVNPQIVGEANHLYWEGCLLVKHTSLVAHPPMETYKNNSYNKLLFHRAVLK